MDRKIWQWLPIFSLILFVGATYNGGCATTGNTVTNVRPQEQDGRFAEVVVSPKFDKEKYGTVLVLPFKVEGKENSLEQYNESASSKFALQLMKIGFTVVDIEQVVLYLKKNKRNIEDIFASDILDKIRKEFKVQAIVKGVMQYEYMPGLTYATGSSAYGNADEWGVNYKQIPGSAISVEGKNRLSSENIKFIDARTNEVLINAYCSAVQNGSISKEIALAIENKTNEGEQTVQVADIELKPSVKYYLEGTELRNRNIFLWKNVIVKLAIVDRDNNVVWYSKKFDAINSEETVNINFDEFINNNGLPVPPLKVPKKFSIEAEAAGRSLNYVGDFPEMSQK